MATSIQRTPRTPGRWPWASPFCHRRGAGCFLRSWAGPGPPHRLSRECGRSGAEERGRPQGGQLSRAEFLGRSALAWKPAVAPAGASRPVDAPERSFSVLPVVLQFREEGKRIWRNRFRDCHQTGKGPASWKGGDRGTLRVTAGGCGQAGQGGDSRWQAAAPPNPPTCATGLQAGTPVMTGHQRTAKETATWGHAGLAGLCQVSLLRIRENQRNKQVHPSCLSPQ
ncbi:uncharacterized protein [Macaca fascicularis]|uniref:uncharacterized protein n=1 Tax=Macaca fascicularis TaxID=9541 RepID=UPI003D1551E9